MSVLLAIAAVVSRISAFDVFRAMRPFVASDHFKVDTSHRARVRIAYVDDQFLNRFGMLVEEPSPRATLPPKQKEQVPVVSLGTLWQLLECQGHGQPGAIRVDGEMSTFLVADAQGVTRHVHLRWNTVPRASTQWCSDADGWFIYAD